MWYAKGNIANVQKLNAPNMLLYARNPTTYKGYDGLPFKFCPWCGQKLEDDEQRDAKEPQ